jgi:hypothetical protein
MTALATKGGSVDLNIGSLESLPPNHLLDRGVNIWLTSRKESLNSTLFKGMA